MIETTLDGRMTEASLKGALAILRDQAHEIERLRAVLRDIACGDVDYVMRGEWENLANWMQEQAEKALEKDDAR